MYEGEVTELTPCETENPMGGYGKTISHVIIGLKTAKGTKQLKVCMVGFQNSLVNIISVSFVFTSSWSPSEQNNCKETVLLDSIILLLSTYFYLFGVHIFWMLVFSPTNWNSIAHLTAPVTCLFDNTHLWMFKLKERFNQQKIPIQFCNNITSSQKSRFSGESELWPDRLTMTVAVISRL